MAADVIAGQNVKYPKNVVIPAHWPYRGIICHAARELLIMRSERHSLVCGSSHKLKVPRYRVHADRDRIGFYNHESVENIGSVRRSCAGDKCHRPVVELDRVTL
jgi:hypothetical protein